MARVLQDFCLPLGAACLLVLGVAGCVRTEPSLMPGDFERPDETVGVLLMPPDVELSEVSTAGGERRAARAPVL